MNAVIARTDWWTSFYQELPLESFMNRAGSTELDDTLNFLWSKLDLREGQLVFDQCCGTGEVSVPLARRGVSIVGVDLCDKFIKIAKGRCEELNLKCEYFKGDAFNFVPDRSCDAAFNWWTSFGYSEDNATNQMMLQRAFDALKPGGSFVLDYPNLPGILHDFKPRTYHYHDTPFGKAVVVRETTINLRKGMREQLWTYLLHGQQRRVHQTALKIYMPNTVVEMLAECGFEQIELFGGLAGEPLTLKSPRCVFVARRAI